MFIGYGATTYGQKLVHQTNLKSIKHYESGWVFTVRKTPYVVLEPAVIMSKGMTM